MLIAALTGQKNFCQKQIAVQENMQPVWIRTAKQRQEKQQKAYKVISARLMRSTDMMTQQF